MLATAGQRDVQRCRRRLRILEEQFEKVTHAVEEQAILRFRLQRQILRHHGRRLLRGCVDRSRHGNADSRNDRFRPEFRETAGKLRFSHLPTRYSCR